MVVPRLSVLSREEVETIHEYALNILEEKGFLIKHRGLIERLLEAGLCVEGGRARFPRDLVIKCLEKAPKTITIYSRDGEQVFRVGGDNTFFNPGSAATKILDLGGTEPRDPVLRDLWDFALVVDALDELCFQSTALVPMDAPIETRDFIRLYPILMVSSKPIVTGAFEKDGVPRMLEILSVFSDQSVKPIAVFDLCPSPPLSLSEIASQNIIDLAENMVPIEIIPMPQIGATAPVTILGSLIQHHAEALACITIAQIIRSGAPVIYGGSPTVFDMRYGTTAIASPESLLLTTLYIEVAKYFNLPTHAYMGLSDSKEIDYQAGLETGWGVLIALLKSVNIVSGPGMIEFENTQSLEKLVIDAEAISEARSFVRELLFDQEHLAYSVILEAIDKGNYLTHKHTIKYMRKELTHPKIIDRMDRGRWIKKGKLDIRRRAREKVKKILEQHKPNLPPPDLARDLKQVINNLCKQYGYSIS